MTQVTEAFARYQPYDYVWVVGHDYTETPALIGRVRSEAKDGRATYEILHIPGRTEYIDGAYLTVVPDEVRSATSYIAEEAQLRFAGKAHTAFLPGDAVKVLKGGEGTVASRVAFISEDVFRLVWCYEVKQAGGGSAWYAEKDLRLIERARQSDVVIYARPFEPGAKLPTYGTEAAAGSDLYAYIVREPYGPDEPLAAGLPENLRPNTIVVAPGASAVISTGLNVRIPDGWELQIRPRSGMGFKYDTVIHYGTIDADFDGDGNSFLLRVKIFNLSEVPLTISHNDRIAQAIASKVPRIEWRLDQGDNPQRVQSSRKGGLGHTGR